MSNPIWKYASALLLVLALAGLGAGFLVQTKWVEWSCASMLALILLRLETLIMRTHMFDEDLDD